MLQSEVLYLNMLQSEVLHLNMLQSDVLYLKIRQSGMQAAAVLYKYYVQTYSWLLDELNVP